MKPQANFFLHSDKDHDFRLIWFTATGNDAEAKFEQFSATIYGTTKIVAMNNEYYRNCYFFRNSEFHRHAEIVDGAVVARVSESSISIKLCLNPLSPQFNLLKTHP